MAGLRRCWMWRSWAGVVTRRQVVVVRPVGSTAKITETPWKMVYGGEMNIHNIT